MCSPCRPGWRWSCLVPAILFTLLVGDELGVIEARYQPMKIAAAEAQWSTCQPCSFSLFQIGGGNNDQTPTEIIAVPHLLSLLATNHWNGKVIGLSPLQSQYSKTYGPGYYVPNVFIQYWAMRAMAYLGVVILVIAGWGLWLIRRRETRDVPGVFVGGDLGRGAAVPAEHRGLAADRVRPAAVDRAGHHADQERDLPVAVHHLDSYQPGVLRRAVRGDRHGRLAADAKYSRKQLPPARAEPTRTRRCRRFSTRGPRWAASCRSGSSSSRSSGPGSSSWRGSTSASACCTAWSGTGEAGGWAAINTIGPLWDGNEVWLIVAGAGMFAAFPGWYATMFSALNLALVLLSRCAHRPRGGVRVPRQA